MAPARRIELAALALAIAAVAVLLLCPKAREATLGALALAGPVLAHQRARLQCLTPKLREAEKWVGAEISHLSINPARFALKGSPVGGIGTIFSHAALAAASLKGSSPMPLTDIVNQAEAGLVNLIKQELWSKVPTPPAALQPAVTQVETDIDNLAVQTAVYLSVKLVYSKAPDPVKAALKAAFPNYGLA